MITATKMIVVAAPAITVLHVSVAAIGVSPPLYGGVCQNTSVKIAKIA